MLKFPKPKRYVDPLYLDYIRTQDCVVLGCRNRPIYPHHTISRGAGGSDLLTLPVCLEHHNIFEALQLDDRDYALDGWKLLAKYIEENAITDGITAWVCPKCSKKYKQYGKHTLCIVCGNSRL